MENMIYESIFHHVARGAISGKKMKIYKNEKLLDEVTNLVDKPNILICTFDKKFFTGTTAIGGSTTAFNPVVFININNMQTNDFFTIDSVSSTQFQVSIKNGSSFVSRSFTYSAFGYGEG